MKNADRNCRWSAAMTAAISMMLAAIAAPAQTYTTLFSFAASDGSWPIESPLVQAADGSFLGTTSSWGVYGYGTIFKVTTKGDLRTLYNFCSQTNCSDGGAPEAGLLPIADGSFYGTTTRGGACPTGQNCGTVFRVDSTGSLTTVYRFCTQAGCPDGSSPSGLFQGPDGDFYGTTAGGGTYDDGTIFRLTPGGVLTTLYSFGSQTGDGVVPGTVLIRGKDGNFYGTTLWGGLLNDSCFGLGCGTVFKVTPSGKLTTVYSFCSQSNCQDGDEPTSSLVLAPDGDFYGTAASGGLWNSGTVFKLSSEGTLTVLYNFCSEVQCADGQAPYAPLIQATDGNFYGTANQGGIFTYPLPTLGTLFEITPQGSFTLLHSFGSQPGDGTNPDSALVQGTNGTLYGTTTQGGTAYGTIFSLSAGLGAFVEPRPASGKAGRSITILGTNLTGATSVTFNGTPATFTVESATAIKTTVPIGATSGPVQVVTPSGTLTSNVNFQVLP